VSNQSEDLPYRWVPWSLKEFAEPYYTTHPERAASVKAALNLIAADPYALQVREYMGHDESGRLYAYALNEQIDIVFGVIENKPWLVLRGINDFRELDP
jgi:hypothetical protein